jgi:hypothetical protein
VALNIRDPTMAQFLESQNPKDWPSFKFFGVYSANDPSDMKTSEWAEFMKHNYHRELVKRRDFYLDTIETSTNSTFKSCKAAFNLLREQSNNFLKDKTPEQKAKDNTNEQLSLSSMMAIVINNDIHIAGCGNFIALVCSERGQKVQIVRGESQRDSCGVYLNNDSSLLLDLGVSMTSDRALGRFQELNSSTSILNVTSLK